jgi:F-type H+-transporting ATPase subunit epsilon
MKLEIVTPDRRLLTTESAAITVPGENGEIEVLDGHAPLLAGLGTGILSFVSPAGKSVRLMISGGFCEVDVDHITVLADDAALPEDVDAPEVRKALEQMQADLKALSPDDADFHRLTAEVERAAAKLEIV